MELLTCKIENVVAPELIVHEEGSPETRPSTQAAATASRGADIADAPIASSPKAIILSARIDFTFALSGAKFGLAPVYSNDTKQFPCQTGKSLESRTQRLTPEIQL